jgi:hypothetical protein
VFSQKATLGKKKQDIKKTRYQTTGTKKMLKRDLQQGYRARLAQPSDINEHLVRLYGYARKCDHVTEAGVRSVVSSYALALGLSDRPKKGQLVQVDLDTNDAVTQFGAKYAPLVNVKFHHASVLECPIEPTDLLFIDTWHVYGQLKRELARWHASVRKYIIMHDTTVDAVDGEALRCNQDVRSMSAQTGIPVGEITKGLWPAVEEFLEANKEWIVESRHTNNNGLTILKRVRTNHKSNVRAYLTHNYDGCCRRPSDINEHLPVLREHAEQCNHVTEAGVRSVVSSYALALGLARRGGRLVQIDLQTNDAVAQFGTRCKPLVDVEFHHASVLECPMEPTDLLFIDTWHVYGQLKRELARWHASVSKYIIMHDTTVDAVDGEALRNGDDARALSAQTGIPVDEVTKGLWPAVEEFLAAHGEWALKRRYTNNNGLTILQRQ